MKDTSAGISWKERVRLDVVRKSKYRLYSDNEEPVCCKTFGCGNKLSFREQIMGDICVSCFGKVNPVASHLELKIINR